MKSLATKLTVCSLLFLVAMNDSFGQEVGEKNWTSETPVGKIVATSPQTARVFELVGIDYCCGGQKPLNEAAKENDVDVRLLLRALAVVGTKAQDKESKNFQNLSTKELIDHIVKKYHQSLRTDLPVLVKTTQLVYEVHGKDHPELKEVLGTVKAISKSILPHIDEEEKITFPLILKLEMNKNPAEVQNHLKEILDDHHQLGHHLLKLRKLTSGFVEPEGACQKYKEMLSGLEKLETDTLQHVHLENNLLFPRIKKIADPSGSKSDGKKR